MPGIQFVDTSILLNLLDVPHMNQDHTAVVDEMKERRASGVRFVLPITAVVETGNHIAQIADGYHRRVCAQRFVDMLELVAERKAPWVLHEVGWDGRFLRVLAAGASSGVSLVEHALNKVGCGDLCILAERDRYLAGVSSGVTAEIWTLDQGLAGWS